VPVLLEALADDRPEVRRAAALALGRTVGSGNRDALRKLIAAARDDRDAHVRCFATMALGRIGSPRALGTLRYVLDRPAVQERGFAALALALVARAGEDEAFRKKVGSILLEELGDGGAEDEAAAAIGLGLLVDRRAVAPVTRMLERTGRPGCRGHGAVALALLGAREALPGMRRAILEEKSPWVQRELAVALGLFRDRESVSALAGLVRTGGSEWDRANAACALGRIATAESAVTMVGLLTSPRTSDSARGRVAEAIGPLLDERPFPPLFPIVEDWDYGLPLEVFQQVLHLL
jgi:HEAT repeat protein